MSHIYSVRELTDAVKRALEGGFPFVWVKGQVSGVTRAASGHVYFSLKDADAVLGCVWFRGSQRGEETFDPLTGEVFEDGPRPGLARTLRDGMEIMCAGRLNVYPPRGTYQMVVELAQDAGLGRLYQQFEELKRSLAAKGYFDAERKRPLPYHPTRVAVVTAATGAAIRDFIRIAGERGWDKEIRIYPSLVQGEAAPGQLVQAIERANADKWAQVVVLVRGGGSLEDLWAFNDIRVAEAVIASSTPVLSGVGHEVDVTITDMVADVRAATPSHAAQVLWPERATVTQMVDECALRLTRCVAAEFRTREQQLAVLARGLQWLSPAQRVQRWEERLGAASARMGTAWNVIFSRAETRLTRLSEQLSRAMGPQRLTGHAQRLAMITERLTWGAERMFTRQEQSCERLALRLAALNPMAPLERGYSLVRREDGSIVRSVADVRVGEPLRLAVADGVVRADVTGLDVAAPDGGDDTDLAGAPRSSDAPDSPT